MNISIIEFSVLLLSGIFFRNSFSQTNSNSYQKHSNGMGKNNSQVETHTLPVESKLPRAKGALNKPKQSLSKEKYSAYLFVYFTGNENDGEAIRFAISDDGYHFRALYQNQPVLSSKVNRRFKKI